VIGREDMHCTALISDARDVELEGGRKRRWWCGDGWIPGDVLWMYVVSSCMILW